jgi:hypothetical protein
MKTYTNSVLPLTWESAIADAEKEIQKSQARVRRLRESIKTFKTRLKKDDPFPSEEVHAHQPHQPECI